MSKTLIIIGLALLLVGGSLWLFENLNFTYKNPLDFSYRSENLF